VTVELHPILQDDKVSGDGYNQQAVLLLKVTVHSCDLHLTVAVAQSCPLVISLVFRVG